MLPNSTTPRPVTEKRKNSYNLYPAASEFSRYAIVLGMDLQGKHKIGGAVRHKNVKWQNGFATPFTKWENALISAFAFDPAHAHVHAHAYRAFAKWPFVT